MTKTNLRTAVASKLQVIIGSFSFFCFLFQALQVTHQYFSYETVVKTDFSHTVAVQMPAVTICAPVLFPFRSFCQPEESMNDCIGRLMQEASSRADEADNPIEFGYLVRIFHENRLFSSKPVLELYKNLTDLVQVEFCQFAHIKTNKFFATILEYCENYTKPQYSLVYNAHVSNTGEFCVTMFSEFEPDYKVMQVNRQQVKNTMIKLLVRLPAEYWFPPGFPSDGVNFAVHPANLLPRDTFWKFNRILANKAYNIEYGITRSYLMPFPYKTNCRNYSDPDSDSMSRYDCIRRCIFRKSKNHEKNCYGQWEVIRLADLTPDDYLCSREVEFDQEFYEVRRDCAKMCRKSCFTEYYDVTMEVSKEKYHTIKNITDISEVTVKIKTKDILNIHHMPEMLFGNYIANVGGLAGIYLGLSVVALYHQIVNVLVRAKKFCRANKNLVDTI